MNKTKQEVWLVYDGECPICRPTANALKIRAAVGKLHLVNAREPHPIMKEIKKAGFDIDRGMVVKIDNTLYHGADAQNILALIGTKSDLFNRINVLLFSSKISANIFYPFFRMIRNFLLWYKNIPKVDNLREINKQDPLFKSVFAEQWKSLPTILRKHYAISPHSTDCITLTGNITIHRAKLVALFIPVLKLFKLLFPYQGRNLPIVVRQYSKPNSAAFYFERILYFPGKKPYHFHSRIERIKDNMVVEIMNLGFGWRTQLVYEKEKIKLKHKGYCLKFFTFLLPLPITFLIGKTIAEEEALSDQAYRMKMKLVHPWFGKLYEYSGEFTLMDKSLNKRN